MTSDISLRLALDAIDHHHIDGSAFRFELQAKLLAEGRENRRRVGRRSIRRPRQVPLTNLFDHVHRDVDADSLSIRLVGRRRQLRGLTISEHRGFVRDAERAELREPLDGGGAQILGGDPRVLERNVQKVSTAVDALRAAIDAGNA